MNAKEIVDTAIAKVVAPLNAEEMANVNRPFMLAMVNEAYHTIERAALWKFSEAEATVTYSPGANTVSGMPNDFTIPLLVQRVDTGQSLSYWDDRQEAYRKTDKGSVIFYSMWMDELRVWPTPTQGGDLYVRYYRAWTDLSDTEQSQPILPSTWHDLLHEYAAGKLAHRLPAAGERFLTYSRAAPYLENFNQRLGMMLESDLVLKTFDEVPMHSYYSQVMDPENY